MEEPSQFSVGQTAQSLTCSITEKPHTGLDEYPTLVHRARNSASQLDPQLGVIARDRKSDSVLALKFKLETNEPPRTEIGVSDSSFHRSDDFIPDF